MLSSKLLLCTFASAAAFQSSVFQFRLKNQATWKPDQQFRISTTLGVAFTMEPANDDIHLLFKRAQDCVYDCEEGGECSLEDASNLLHDLTLLLSQCGKCGNDNAVCEDQDVAAEVIARLRIISSPTASAAAISEKSEESMWKKVEVPLAILYYFACIFGMIHFGELGVNTTVDIGESGVNINDYMEAASLPPAIILHQIHL